PRAVVWDRALARHFLRCHALWLGQRLELTPLVLKLVKGKRRVLSSVPPTNPGFPTHKPGCPVSRAVTRCGFSLSRDGILAFSYRPLTPNLSTASATLSAAWRTTSPSAAKSPAIQRTPRASIASISATIGDAPSPA